MLQPSTLTAQLYAIAIMASVLLKILYLQLSEVKTLSEARAVR